MSCTVVALPILLAEVIGAIIVGDVAVGSAKESERLRILENNNLNEDIHVINAQHFIEKSFETAFMDEGVLIKTLEEHGVTNIQKGEEWEKGKLTGQVDSFNLSFEKPSPDKPYYLTITCKESDNAEEKLNDLSGEYALNVQEETYLSIIEKLKDNNMELEDEEVLDDNTIVLTVNID